MEHIFDNAPGRTGYRNGCRCDACKEDYALGRRESNRRHRARAGASPLTSGLGTARRLMALRANGWMCEALGQEMGVTAQRISGLSLGSADLVSTGTHARVLSLYDDLKDVEGKGTLRARRDAFRAGGRPPADWEGLDMDDKAVEPVRMSVSTAKMVQHMNDAERHKSGGGSEMRATALEGSTVIPDEHRRPAALTVAAHSRDVAEARDLLTMLGLLEEAA